jgi:hypothetical protein
MTPFRAIVPIVVFVLSIVSSAHATGLEAFNLARNQFAASPVTNVASLTSVIRANSSTLDCVRYTYQGTVVFEARLDSATILVPTSDGKIHRIFSATSKFNPYSELFGHHEYTEVAEYPTNYWTRFISFDIVDADYGTSVQASTKAWTFSDGNYTQAVDHESFPRVVTVTTTSRGTGMARGYTVPRTQVTQNLLFENTRAPGDGRHGAAPVSAADPTRRAESYTSCTFRK